MKTKHLIELICLAAIWGASFFFTKLSVDEFGAIVLTTLRSVIATISLFPLLYFSKQWPAFKQHWKHILVVGLISTALPFSFLTLTTQFSSAGFASILNSMTPIFSAIVAWLWLKEYLSIPAIIGIGLSFIGVLVMIMDTQSISSEFLLLPIFTGVAAAALYGLTGNYSRKFLSGIPTLAIAAGCQLFSSFFLLPFAFILWPENSISVTGWVSALVLGVVCTGIGYILYFRLLENVGVAKTVIVTYLVPVFAMLWGSMFLGEIITVPMIMGTAFILTGIGLTTGMIKKNSHKNETSA